MSFSTSEACQRFGRRDCLKSCVNKLKCCVSRLHRYTIAEFGLQAVVESKHDGWGSHSFACRLRHPQRWPRPSPALPLSTAAMWRLLAIGFPFRLQALSNRTRSAQFFGIRCEFASARWCLSNRRAGFGHILQQRASKIFLDLLAQCYTNRGGWTQQTAGSEERPSRVDCGSISMSAERAPFSMGGRERGTLLRITLVFNVSPILQPHNFSGVEL